MRSRREIPHEPSTEGRKKTRGRVGTLATSAFIAAFTPMAAATIGMRVADDVEHVMNGGKITDSNFSEGYGHPRVVRTGIVGEAILAKHQNEGALGFVTGYVDFVRARFDSRLGSCVTDADTRFYEGAARWALKDKAECLAPIVGMEVEDLREAGKR